MPWYNWLVIGLVAGANAGLFLACLLHCSKEADETTALLKAQAIGHEFGASGAPTKYGPEEVGIW